MYKLKPRRFFVRKWNLWHVDDYIFLYRKLRAHMCLTQEKGSFPEWGCLQNRNLGYSVAASLSFFKLSQVQFNLWYAVYEKQVSATGRQWREFYESLGGPHLEFCQRIGGCPGSIWTVARVWQVLSIFHFRYSNCQHRIAVQQIHVYEREVAEAIGRFERFQWLFWAKKPKWHNNTMTFYDCLNLNVKEKKLKSVQCYTIPSL